MENEKRMDNLVIENGHIMFRNFRGAETQYNKAGNRNFCAVIDDPALAQRLINDGWNVRILKPRDETEDARYYLNVTVRFDIMPPKVFLITKKNKVPLNDVTIANLDSAEIRNVDMIIRPRPWEINGKTGVKAYLKTMYVTIEEDAFADKYAEEECPEDEEYLPFN